MSAAMNASVWITFTVWYQQTTALFLTIIKSIAVLQLSRTNVTVFSVPFVLNEVLAIMQYPWPQQIVKSSLLSSFLSPKPNPPCDILITRGFGSRHIPLGGAPINTLSSIGTCTWYGWTIILRAQKSSFSRLIIRALIAIVATHWYGSYFFSLRMLLSSAGGKWWWLGRGLGPMPLRQKTVRFLYEPNSAPCRTSETFWCIVLSIL